MEKEEQKWEQGLEEEGKEEETLKVRRSRARVEGSPIGSAITAQDTSQPTSSASCETNGHIIQPSESVAENGFDGFVPVEEQQGPEKIVALSDGGVEEVAEITEGHLRSSDSCVYYDKDAENLRGSPNDDESDIKIWNFTVPKGLNSVIDCPHTGNPKDDYLSILQHSEIVEEECGTNYESSKIKEIGTLDADVINESKLEVTDFDVEKVLQNQNTHDLYCPNCNSCITRRVILRKRKRQVRVATEDVKCNKQETATGSEVNDSSGLVSNDLGHETADIHLDATSELATNDYECDREPDIFRCLSCFSIFIPTGQGFKLFKTFGDKGRKTPENQQKSTISTNWRSSIFASDKEKTSMRPGVGIKADAQKTKSEVCMPSSNFNDQSGPPESQKNGDRILHSSKEELDHEKLMLSLVDNSSDAPTVTVKGGAGDARMNNFEAASGSQPNTLDISKDVLAYSQIDQSVAAPTDITCSKGEPPLDAISICQPDGLKILISSNVDSTIERSQKDQNPDQAIQNNGTDPSILSLPTTVSTPREINMNGKMNTGAKVSDMSVDEKGMRFKQSNDDGAFPIELSQHMISKNKDALVLSMKDACLIERGQTKTPKDLKKVTVEHTAGKDTIIVVESGPVTTAPSEKVLDSNAPAEVGTSPYIATQSDGIVATADDSRETFQIEILKSIVYGGLAETIISLGVVSSAAAGGTATINILALALANLIGGLVFTYHNLRELKKDPIEQASNQVIEQIDRYKELLGRRENFFIHATVVVISFLVFGLIPPVTYGFSFRISNDRHLKLLAVGAASLVCIILLATGKEYVRNPPKSYLRTVMYYGLMGFMVSGISYGAGGLIKKLLEELHLFQLNLLHASLPLEEMTPAFGGASF